MSTKRPARKASSGQVAAARLLLKREREGKVTVPITPRIREMANQGKTNKAS